MSRTHTLPAGLVLACACLLSIAAPARAEPPGTGRVAVIDSSKLWEEGGIARWLVAKAKLDAERASFAVVEVPPGKSLDDGGPAPGYFELPGESKEERKKRREESARLQREMQAKALERDAWHAHEREVLEPIEEDVQRALERFARARGIGLVLERAELEYNLVVVAAGVDITDAFIKDYNSKTPAAAAREKP
jgi:hypothetical protein